MTAAGVQMAMTVWRDYLLDDLVRPLAMTSLQVVDLHRYGDESVSLELVAGFVRCLGKNAPPLWRGSASK